MISILYIDDWRPLLNITRRFLERKGDMVVETSPSINDALQKLDNSSFDVIVTDYNSKESGGIDVLRQIRSKGIKIPVVFFISEQNRGLDNEATWYSQVAFVLKLHNFDPGFHELEKTIRTIIPEYSRQKDLLPGEKPP
jgi:CheY-like chemotaxis protein